MADTQQTNDYRRFFELDSNSVGSKGLVLIGDDALVYQRDQNTSDHPGEIDLPGGGPQPGETPFENFRREVEEEFGLRIDEKSIAYVRCYPSSLDPKRTAYFPVAKLPSSFRNSIKFGDEGTKYLLMPFDEYLRRADAWDVFQQRAATYHELTRRPFYFS